MRDQLSLRLEPEIATLPNLPDGLRPMLPRPASEPFDSAAHLFEPAWGGLRAMAFIGPSDAAGGGEVRVADGNGRSVGAHLPELAIQERKIMRPLPLLLLPVSLLAPRR